MANIHTVNLPDIGEGVVEGEVIEWRKQVGEAVQLDEPVVVVMTDKATVELPSPVSGKLAKQYFQPGGIAIKGKPLYDIEVEGAVPTKTPPKTEAPEVAKPSFTTKAPEPKIQLTSEGQKKLATPPTRYLAKEMGVDLQHVSGTGKDGRVTEADVVAYHAGQGQSTPTPSSGKRAAPEIKSSTPILHMPDDEEVPLIGLRHIVAEKMVESKYIVPHYSYFDQADASRLVQMRENMKPEVEKYGFRLTFMPFLIRALSLALKQKPQVNGSVDLVHNKLVTHKHQHIGIAKSTPSGLLVCVLKNVQEMGLHRIIQEYDTLMKKAEAGKLERSDLQESTITISNFGTLGGQWATPIINYPEIAILGVAKIRKMPIVKQDAVVIREMLNLSWSFDHRVIDGQGAAEFSNVLIHLIENPAQLL